MTIPIKIISKKEYLKNNPEPNQEKVWDEIAKSVAKRNFFKVRELNAVHEFLKNKQGVVIDLGCGAGWNMVVNKDILYYGVDFSNESIKLSKKNAEKKGIKTKLFKEDVSKLDKSIFKNEMFDYGLFIATLHCIEGEKKRENALKELFRILKSGAEALISVWNSEDERFDGLKDDIYMSWKEGGISYMRYYHLYDKREIIDLLEKVGFKIIEEYKSREHDRFSRKNWIFKIKK
ncbi:MAG: class I SAM-dependent methyltransferase [Candidatus Nanoarchaeia archaeon]|nr:class I SAM-dependent methyltransferase [Candidatus Nanoarchaeia archaeon]MDD5741645.1 class I SAM-dependent methyltransferase [Candidatus Nanoarchaeia archaeon]